MCLGIPGEIIELITTDSANPQAKVRFGGIVKTINMHFAPEARPQDFVIVHVGFAISVVNKLEAARILETLAELGEVHEIS